jgi:dTMP kinase
MHFLAFEGLDGAGKSTLIRGLKAELEVQGLSVLVSREPGGTPMGRRVRELLLEVGSDHPVPRAEALLYQADRAQHVETVIRPALAEGTWVFSDRFAASSLAFQAGGRAIGEDQIRWLNEFSTGGLQPGLYVLLDLSVEESLRRLAGRPQEADRFEREDRAFHERVREAYLKLAAADPARWLVLNSSDKPDLLLNRLLDFLRARGWV